MSNERVPNYASDRAEILYEYTAAFNNADKVSPQRFAEKLDRYVGRAVRRGEGRGMSDTCRHGESVRDYCGECMADWVFSQPAPTAPSVLDETRATEDRYPCADCGKLRTKDEGGTTFTVCDECWNKHHGRPTAPPVLDEARAGADSEAA